MSRHEPRIEILKAGLLDSVQDQGRPGQARMALSRGGAMDRRAMALANALVGNEPDLAGLEITGPGPTLKFHADAWIASVGARHRIECRSDEAGAAPHSLPTQRPVFVAAGSVLRWHAPSAGLRSWLAVAGGLALPEILSSRSGHLAAGIGPGRLTAGQSLPLQDAAEDMARQRAHGVLRALPTSGGPCWPRWHIGDDMPRQWPVIDLPVLAGRHLHALPDASRESLLSQSWKVSAQSNRQGLRLQGRALDTRALPQLASEPVSFGTVQLPPAGEPVILLAEHQTTGGYPRIFEVASAAETLLAQAGAGCMIRFQLVGLDEADRLASDAAREFGQRLIGVAQACAGAAS